MELLLDVITQLPRFYNEVKNIINEPREKRKEKRLSFFNDYIESIHKTMTLINNDYMKGFFEIIELVKNCNDDEIFSTDLRLEIIKIRSAKIISRAELFAQCEEYKEIKCNKNLYKEYLKEDEMESLIEYTQAIENYLTCGDEYFKTIFTRKEKKLDRSMSNYRALLYYIYSYLDEKTQFDREKLEKYEIHRIGSIIISYCISMTGERLPRFFSKYFRKYMKLKFIYCK